MLTQVVASALGGYLAGRLRTKWAHLHTDEVYFRDTAHGLLSWATSVVATAAFLTSAIAALVGGREQRSEPGVTTAQSASAEGAPDRGARVTDLLFRSQHPNAGRSDADVRSEGGRIIATGIREGGLSPADRTYLGTLVAAQAGVSQSDADQRVSNVFVQAQGAVDRERKTAASLSLWMFLGLLGGAFCASLAATIGGRQRDRVVRV